MVVDLNDFQTGTEFIAFGSSPPPTTNAQAGPSRPTNSDSKGIGKRSNDLDSDDERILATRNGRRETNGRDKKGKGKETSKEKEKEKGKKRARVADDNDTGPRNLKEERRAAERNVPWADMVGWEECRDPAEMLNQEITAFHKYVSPTKQEFEVRLFIIELITKAVMQTWPEAEVSPFGSWQTQLYLPSGDIDLVVATNRFSEANKGKMLAELARAMRQAYITDVVAIISKARVPIIKFVTLEGKLNVDISLNQTNGISAGKIINQYLDVLPGARQLIMVVKSFLSQRSMNEVYTGGLGSYAVICLVISFLQVHPKLRRSEIDPEQNLGTLLIEFFELYGRNFHFDRVGLSIRRGGFYYSKQSRGWLRPGQPYLLSIEDPQDKDNDISGGSFGIRQVKATLAGAYEMLQARLFERAEWISGRKSGRYSDDVDPEELSILSGIMGITKETVKHRQSLKKLHEEGRLQRMLGIPIDSDSVRQSHHYSSPPRRSTTRPQNHRSFSPPRRQNDPTISAIVVDDSSEPEGVYDDYAADSDEDLDHHGDSEIIEVLGHGQARNRIASVSPDSFSDDPPHTEDHNGIEEDDDSRYSVRKPQNGSKVHLTDGDLEEFVSSDDSVIMLDSAPVQNGIRNERARAKSRFNGKRNGGENGNGNGNGSAISKEERRKKADERRAFWAGKGVGEAVDGSEEEIGEGS